MTKDQSDNLKIYNFFEFTRAQRSCLRIVKTVPKNKVKGITLQNSKVYYKAMKSSVVLAKRTDAYINGTEQRIHT